MYVLKMLKYSRVRGKRGFLGCLRARTRTDCNLISEDDRAMRLSGPDGMGSGTAAGGGSACKQTKKKTVSCLRTLNIPGPYRWPRILRAFYQLLCACLRIARVVLQDTFNHL